MFLFFPFAFHVLKRASEKCVVFTLQNKVTNPLNDLANISEHLRINVCMSARETCDKLEKKCHCVVLISINGLVIYRWLEARHICKDCVSKFNISLLVRY